MHRAIAVVLQDGPTTLDRQTEQASENGFMMESNFKAIMGSKARENLRIMRYRNIKPLMVDAIQLNGPADVRTCRGVLHAGAGDWLVRDPQGNVNVCDNWQHAQEETQPLLTDAAFEHSSLLILICSSSGVHSCLKRTRRARASR